MTNNKNQHLKPTFKNVMYALIYNNPGLVAWPLAIIITLICLLIFDMNGPFKDYVYHDYYEKEARMSGIKH
jgi:hypothetical protein